MIWKLTKINIRALFAGKFRGYRKKKRIKPVTAILIGLLAAYVVGALMLTIGALFYSLSATLFDTGLGWFYFALAGLFVFVLGFIGSIFMVGAQIFNARDNELLISMPLKPGEILAGRLFALLIIEYLYEALILIPVFVALVMTGYITRLPAIGGVFFLLSAVLLPLLTLALGCLVGWLVALVSSRLRRKNIPNLIMSVVFLAAFFWLYYSMMGNVSVLIENGAAIADAVRRAVFPAYYLGVAIADGSFPGFIIFAACAAASFALMYYLLSASFMKIAAGARTAKKIAYREKELRASGAGSALVRRELRRFATMPMYILNTSLGMIASIALAVVLIVYPSVLLDPLEQLTAAMPFLDKGVIAVAILAALAAFNNISSPSISLEGKTLWVVKSLPVRSRDVLFAKAGMHILLGGIPSVIAGFACIFTLGISNPVHIALVLVMPLSVTLAFALLGVTLNLAFPRFDWINPVQPVKQGISSMLTLFGGMGLIVAVALVYTLALGPEMSLEAYMLICTTALLAASAAMMLYLRGAGSRKFDEL